MGHSLESKGMTSVYIDGKFVWQLPKALLLQRVPGLVLKDYTDGDAASTDIPSVWEIKDCSRDTFRIFNDWLYSPNGRVKAASGDVPIKAYFEAIKFAGDYNIPAFLECLVAIVMQTLKDPQGETLTQDLQQIMGSESSGGAIVSGNLAAMLQHGMLDAGTVKLVMKTPELARDVLVWIELFRQCDVGKLDQAEKVKWASENISKWVEIQE